MNEYWTDILGGGKSLLVGLSITAREFFKPVVTEQYPWVVPEMAERFRGHIELIGDEETGKPKCVVCGMCMRSCPSHCISLRGKKPEGKKKKELTQYHLDFTTCSLCGTCIESCNFGAIRFSKDYNLAGTSRDAYIFDLLKRLEEQT